MGLFNLLLYFSSLNKVNIVIWLSPVSSGEGLGVPCGWTISISSTWKLVRNPESQLLSPQLLIRIRISIVSVHDLRVQYSWRNYDLANI